MFVSGLVHLKFCKRKMQKVSVERRMKESMEAYVMKKPHPEEKHDEGLDQLNDSCGLDVDDE